ncbi:hypothetical protein AB9F38_35390, partial [Rhizobium leguminosarum]
AEGNRDRIDLLPDARLARHLHFGQRRWLTVPEIFQYSSNIGTERVIDIVGIDAQKDYLTKLGLLTKMQTELPEVKMPSQPR